MNFVNSLVVFYWAATFGILCTVMVSGPQKGIVELGKMQGTGCLLWKQDAALESTTALIQLLYSYE